MNNGMSYFVQILRIASSSASGYSGPYSVACEMYTQPGNTICV